MIELPKKKYNIIYADPPWSYEDKANAGKRGAGHKYPTQSQEWICNLPVKELSAEDCILFLWVTMPHLNKVMEVIEAWGFTYKTCGFNWVKTNKGFPTQQTSFLPQDIIATFWGMGSWTRANSELCLLATKGKPQRVSSSVQQVVLENIREHSRKPDCVRDRIVELCGDLPRIELFAREKIVGWDVWGNETDKFDTEQNYERK